MPAWSRSNKLHIFLLSLLYMTRSAWLPTSTHRSPTSRLSVYLSVHLSIDLSTRPSMCLSVYPFHSQTVVVRMWSGTDLAPTGLTLADFIPACQLEFIQTKRERNKNTRQ